MMGAALFGGLEVEGKHSEGRVGEKFVLVDSIYRRVNRTERSGEREGGGELDI